MSKDLEKFATSSLRGLKKGIYEQLQCSLLVKGIQTDKPLTKISSICEAALLSKNKKNLDLETVNVCNDVYRSLQNTFPTKTGNTEYVNVAWIFVPSEENFNQYIKAWHRISLHYYPLLTVYRQIEYRESRKQEYVSPFGQIDYHNKFVEFEDRLTRKIEDDLQKYSEDFRFFVVTSALDFRSYLILKGEFTNWALTQLSDTRRKVAEEISPQVWREFTRQEKQEKEEKREDE